MSSKAEKYRKYIDRKKSTGLVRTPLFLKPSWKHTLKRVLANRDKSEQWFSTLEKIVQRHENPELNRVILSGNAGQEPPVHTNPEAVVAPAEGGVQ